VSECGERDIGTIQPHFDASIRVGFGGARLTSDTGFLLLREVDERFDILVPAVSGLHNHRSQSHTRHTLLEMIRQRIYQIAAGYEDCNDADFLRNDPALRLAAGKKWEIVAGQSAMSRLENTVLGNGVGIMVLEKAIARSADALLGQKVKPLLIVDMDSTEDPAYGTQEQVAYNGHFQTSCFHPLFAFSSDGTCLAARLRPGNVHSANGSLSMLEGLTRRHRHRARHLWFRADAAFAKPEHYEHCEANGVTYFIRLPANAILKEHIEPDLHRPVGRPPKHRPQVRIVEFEYLAKKWAKPRRVVCKIEWHAGELFPRVGFIVTNSKLSPEKVVRVYNGRGDVENRIKEGKLTLRWDKTSCRRFQANEARLLMGVIAYNLLHLIRRHYMKGEPVRRSLEWMIRRLIKVATKVSYHARRWHVHVSSSFPLAHHYRAVFSP
jgi:hypothetical protein